MNCDRCGTSADVTMFDECEHCGPVPLCRDCQILHLEEMAEEEAWEE